MTRRSLFQLLPLAATAPMAQEVPIANGRNLEALHCGLLSVNDILQLEGRSPVADIKAVWLEEDERHRAHPIQATMPKARLPKHRCVP